jgi:hypothetical protein
MKLCFRLRDLDMIGYGYADFASNVDGKKYTSGYIFIFGGTVVSWLSKKQICVAKFTMEVKYIACNIMASMWFGLYALLIV